MDDGFTLIELMVVFAIAGLILSFAPINWTGIIGGRSFDRDIEDVTRMLDDTRMSAILGGTERRVLFDVVTGNCSSDAGNEIKATQKACFDNETEVSFVSARQEQIDENTSAIRFFADGSSTGGRIVAQRNGKQVQIIVDWLTGDVTVSKPD
ncbi:GspH/FimT family pseudopilin [Thalassospira sp.]|uniref:GspH/FimT family pseudopilin n=1 Tax=Thalassospira sp. TaxID=1912094 RepID=UPI0032EB3579